MGGEVTLEVAHGEFGALALRIGQPGAGQADGQAAEEPQDEEALGCADAAAVLVQADVQALVQLGLDGPVAATAGQQGGRAVALGIGAGDEAPALAPALALGATTGVQLADLGGGDEADLFRRGVPQAQPTPFPPPSVAFPALGRPRRVRRGKVRSPPAFLARCCATWIDWL